jgi:uncharacterized protein (TIGR02246 family)
MKTLTLTISALALAAGPAFAQGTATAAIEKQLMANEHAINEAVAKGDAKTFTSLLTTDSMATDGSGTMPAADFVKMMPMLKLTAQKLDAMKVAWLTPDVALVTYTWSGTGTMQGEKVPSPDYANTVWVKQKDGKWLARFHQESLAFPAPPAAPKKP